MWHCNWGYPFFQHPLFGILINILVMALLAAAVVFIVRSFLPKSSSSRDAADSLEILKRKYALGEISEEEYARMKEILTGG